MSTFNAPIALCQIRTIPGQVQQNLQSILDGLVEGRKQGAQLFVFPELTLSGYFALDKTFDKEFLREQRDALKAIAPHTKGIVVVVGVMREAEGELRGGGRPKVYNAAAVFENGALLGFQDKRLLPDYDVFDESRYFVSGNDAKVFQTSLGKLGVEICEDLWIDGYDHNPAVDLKRNGAELLINISASPFELGKLEQRIGLLQRAASQTGLPIVYINLVGGFDGYEGEVVFDGQSLIISAGGEIRFLGAECKPEISVQGVAGDPMVVPASDETESIYTALCCGLQSYFDRFRVTKAIVGVSGGVDSAVVAAMAATVLGAENLKLISMPSKFNQAETQSDARTLARNIGAPFEEIPIETLRHEITSLLKESKFFSEGTSDVALENIQPRLRMSILFAISNRSGGLVLNTGNKTELALGYSTIYGDMAGALAVLGDVNKRQVYDLAKRINLKAGRAVIPEGIITRPPTAELRLNQTDAQGMGEEPVLIADAVDALIQGYSKEQVRSQFDQFSPELIDRLAILLAANEWKRRQAPPAIKLSTKAFGHGRRVSIG